MMNIDRHASEENNGIDSISSLPDDVRTHILSFLSTKEAVQTCILSKRWINTWASVLDLKFYTEEFAVLVFGPMIPSDKMDVEFVTKIELVLRSVLEKRETSCVNRFQLLLDSGYFFPWTRNLADCISDVMKLGPLECLLEMGLCENLNLNVDDIFSCASLIHLQLCLSTQFDVFVVIELSSVNLPCLKTLNLKGVMLSIAIEPNSVNLACLKTLNLDGVTMTDDSFKKLLLGCPFLEELLLEDCNISIIEICSNALKKFFIFSYHDVMKLQISTPNLLYLDIFVIAIGEIMLLNMPSLVDASIYIPGWYDQDIYITRGPKIFHSLSNVESLRLQFGFPVGKVQKKDFSSYPVFNNLRCLKFVISRFHVFDLAPYFLHHSPKLQELTLTNRHATVTEFVDDEITQEGLGDALVQREFLKTIRIVGFKNDNELVDRLINKLLAHVKIIGDIVIDP